MYTYTPPSASHTKNSPLPTPRHTYKKHSQNHQNSHSHTRKTHKISQKNTKKPRKILPPLPPTIHTHIQETHKKSQKQTRMDFLFEGGGPGSTFVFNRKFVLDLKKNLKKNKKVSKKINFHDWYIYFYARVNNYKWYIDYFSGLKYCRYNGSIPPPGPPCKNTTGIPLELPVTS